MVFELRIFKVFGPIFQHVHCSMRILRVFQSKKVLFDNWLPAKMIRSLISDIQNFQNKKWGNLTWILKINFIFLRVSKAKLRTIKAYRMHKTVSPRYPFWFTRNLNFKIFPNFQYRYFSKNTFSDATCGAHSESALILWKFPTRKKLHAFKVENLKFDFCL